MTDEEFTRFDQMFRAMGEDPMMMYRAKSPFANNRDEFNDVTNYAPTANQQTYDLGTDDAGNPILGNTMTDAIANSVKPKSTRGYTGFNAGEVSERILADEEGGETNLSELIDGGRVDLGREIAGLHEKAKDTALYAQYMYSAEDWAAKSKEIFDETGMDLNPRENKEIFEKAWSVAKEAKRQKALATDANGHVNMDKVYDAMPYLRDIHEAHGTAAAVMVMQSAQDLKTINDIYDTEGGRFAASLKYGIYRGGLQMVNQWKGIKGMVRGAVSNEGLTPEDINDILWVSNEMKSLPKNSYSSIGGAFGGALGSAAENLPIYAPELIRGALTLYGGPVGAAAAGTLGNALSYAAMSAQIAGAQYIENITKADEDGNPIYTPRQAALLSAGQGLAEGYLEKRSLATAGKAIFDATTAKRIAAIYAKGDAALAAGQTAENLTRAIIGERIRHGVKAGFLSGAAELEEEFEQQISDMVLENMAQIAFRGDKADVSSVEEILSDAFGAAVDAVPAVVGFGMVGGAIGAKANAKELGTRILSAQERLVNAQASQIARGIYENEHRNNVTEAVREALPKRLNESAPDVLAEILDRKNEEAGFVFTQVDIRTLSQDEKNKDLVEQVVKASGASEADVQACLAPGSTGMLNVKTSALEMAQGITPEQQKVLNQHTAHNGRNTIHQELEAARIVRESMKAVQEQTDAEKKAAIENFARGSFKDDEATQNLARDIVSTDPDNPARVLRKRMKENKEAINNILGGTIAALKSEGKQGTAVVETLDNNGDVATARISNNPEWYRNFYEDEGREPTNADYERIAYENATGTATRYALTSFDNLPPEALANFEDVKQELDALLAERESLRKINAVLGGVRAGEFLPTASLSVEGREAFNELTAILGSSKNKNISKNATVNALIAARMAERTAQMWREAGQNKTARDVMPQVLEQMFKGTDAAAQAQTAIETELPEMSDTDGHLGWIKEHPFQYDESKSIDENIARAEKMAQDYMDKFGGTDQINTPERQELRLRIARMLYGEGAAQKDGRIWLIVGAPASGKSTIAESIRVENGALLIDSDKAKELLPEYSNGLLATAVHEESSDIVNDVLDTAMDANDNIVMPVVGKTYSSLKNKIDYFSSEGYEVNLVYVDLPIQKAIERVKNRFKEEGRLVAPSYLESVGLKPKENYDILKTGEEVDSYEAWNNDVARGVRPILIERSASTGSTETSGRMGRLRDQRQRMESVRAKTEREENADSNSINNELAQESRSDNQGGFSNARNRVTRGDYNNLKNLVRLFETADQSTFMHEMSHFYLGQLEQIAAISPPNSQAAKDYATVKAWAEWHEGDAAAFEGTATAKEFAEREALIMEAKEKGFVEIDGKKKTLADLQYEWLQEKFARGFEDYLESGNAPSSLLQKVFRSFVNWLKDIYKGVVGIGVKPSAEVEAVMARMVASDEEIEMMATIRAAESIAKISPDLLDGDTASMHERWSAEAKEEAKEKLRKKLLKELRERDIETHMKEYEKAEREQLQELPVFQAELLVKETDGAITEEEAAAECGYSSVEAWKQDLESMGGSFENALKESCDLERDRFKREMPNDEQLLEMAEEAMLSSEYAEKLENLEAEILARREKKYNEAPARLARAMQDVENALDETELYDPFRAALRKLKYAYRWDEQQQKRIEEMQAEIDSLTETEEELRKYRQRIAEERDAAEAAKEAAETKTKETKAELKEKAKAEKTALKEKAKAEKKELREKLTNKAKEEKAALKEKAKEEKEALREKSKEERDALKEKHKAEKERIREKLKAQYQALKNATLLNAEWMKGVRDAANGRTKEINAFAKATLATMAVRDSTNVRHWLEEERKAQKDCLRYLTKAITKNKGKLIGAVKEKSKTEIAGGTKELSTEFATGASENIKPRSGEEEAREAYFAKLRAAAFFAQAREALKLKRELQRIQNDFKRILQALAKDEKGNIDANTRYYIQHILFMLGFKRGDAIAPETLIGLEQHIGTLMEQWEETNHNDDPMKNKAGEMDVDFELPEWILRLATPPGGKNVKSIAESYKDYTIEELRDIRQLVDMLFKIAQNKNRLLTLDMSIDEAVEDLQDETRARIVDTQGERPMAEFMAEVMKPEHMLRILGGEDGKWVRYIYDVLNDATRKQEDMGVQVAEELAALFDKYYTEDEQKAMHNGRVIIRVNADGTVSKVNESALRGEINQAKDYLNRDRERGIHEYTRNQLLSMALNWGNEGNRERLLNGEQITEETAREIFRMALDARDWAFVQDAWDYIQRFGDQVNEIHEKALGVAMKRIPPDAFDMETSDGETVHLRGGYYHIAYDPKKARRQTEREISDARNSFGGATVFKTGMGSTKARAKNSPNLGPLLLDLSVLQRNIDEQLHIINFRLPCRDVAKLLQNPNVRGMIENSLGRYAYRQLYNWAFNIWQAPMITRMTYDRTLGFIRRNTVSAIMGFRIPTSALNLANVATMADAMGSVDAACAIGKFAQEPRAMWARVMEKSTFMRSKWKDTEKDFELQKRKLFKGQRGALVKMRDLAGVPIEFTDMLTAVPAWDYTFTKVFNASLDKGLSQEKAEYEAIRKADQVVRDMVGSYNYLDRSAVQRREDELHKALLPFYSFFNTMFSVQWEKYYEGKYVGRSVERQNPDGTTRLEAVKRKFSEAYWDFARKWFFRGAVMVTIETCLREAMNQLAGGGEDDKDREAMLKRMLADYGKNLLSNQTGGLPLWGQLIDGYVSASSGYRSGSRFGGVASAGLDRFETVWKKLISAATKENYKPDYIEIGRDASKAFFGTGFGIPDTPVDTFWNSLRLFLDSSYRIEDDFREWLFKSLFDKKLKKKGR